MGKVYTYCIELIVVVDKERREKEVKVSGDGQS